MTAVIQPLLIQVFHEKLLTQISANSLPTNSSALIHPYPNCCHTVQLHPLESWFQSGLHSAYSTERESVRDTTDVGHHWFPFLLILFDLDLTSSYSDTVHHHLLLKCPHTDLNPCRSTLDSFASCVTVRTESVQLRWSYHLKDLPIILSSFLSTSVWPLCSPKPDLWKYLPETYSFQLISFALMF